MVDLEKIARNIIKGRADKDCPWVDDMMGQPGVRELTERAIKEGIPTREILNNGLLAGMNVVAVKFKNNEMFFPEVLQSAQALKAGIALLKPLFQESGIKPMGKMVIGTAQGDLHDIGKTLVGMMVEGAGFEVKDLGVDVSPERFVSAVEDEMPDIVGISALLTTTMPGIHKVIQALEEAELRHKVKVVVGGAPITEAFAKEIGADGFASDAGTAVDKIKAFLGL
ncbi:MAG: corrinoid protein [Dehalococcoidia bacterium]